MLLMSDPIFLENSQYFISVASYMQLELVNNCYGFLSETECSVSDNSRHEDTASSCTATEQNSIEDGRSFRGTS